MAQDYPPESNHDASSLGGKGLLFCPSAQPGLDGSVLLGTVHDGPKGPYVSYLNRLVKVTDGTMLAFLGSSTNPTEIYRFAAPCEKSGCRNWSGSSCRVVESLVQILPAVTGELPDCKLRPKCRWFQQEGKQACHRCPQVLTDDKDFEASLNQIVVSDSPSRAQTEVCTEF